uniref:Uncharacterized protein n=1 Tax=Chromera velia CCMP2878 TaxID=1169474 RepID=A0A0G4GD24_9ALVE|eukprot:Cvel_21358.t1-p1 / transcript=Cvel_21358.t1 / gene=Cvel_21358 / organism=Chromera_velia_CCMP2878 / gene_product=hypothetical protein / transcript_product=hypothetical protein / location=Cvel_scaffold1996:16063-18815(+) / protein_length=611 / sequence_SO=supercontig / SO=protein_coding / is_pseudo=false
MPRLQTFCLFFFFLALQHVSLVHASAKSAVGTSSLRPFLASNGQLVIEAESADSTGTLWGLHGSSETPGSFQSTGFLRWDGKTQWNTPAVGTLTYPFVTDEPGEYTVKGRVSRESDPNTTEENDHWLRILDSSGKPLRPLDQNGRCPTRTGQTNCVEADGWLKFYYSGVPVNEWRVHGKNVDHNAIDIKYNINAGQLYTIEISGRSQGLKLDRFGLSNKGGFTDLLNDTPESARSATTPSPPTAAPPNPPPPPPSGEPDSSTGESQQSESSTPAPTTSTTTRAAGGLPIFEGDVQFGEGGKVELSDDLKERGGMLEEDKQRREFIKELAQMILEQQEQQNEGQEGEEGEEKNPGAPSLPVSQLPFPDQVKERITGVVIYQAGSEVVIEEGSVDETKGIYCPLANPNDFLVIIRGGLRLELIRGEDEGVSVRFEGLTKAENVQPGESLPVGGGMKLFVGSATILFGPPELAWWAVLVIVFCCVATAVIAGVVLWLLYRRWRHRRAKTTDSEVETDKKRHAVDDLESGWEEDGIPDERLQEDPDGVEKDAPAKNKKHEQDPGENVRSEQDTDATPHAHDDPWGWFSVFSRVWEPKKETKPESAQHANSNSQKA